MGDVIYVSSRLTGLRFEGGVWMRCSEGGWGALVGGFWVSSG